jgi:hypothetical protein
MCWNEQVSLNTFLFSSGVLALIVYNNQYTQYKIPTFQNPFFILFICLVIFVQLAEYFVWVSLKTHNDFLNMFGTIFIFILVSLQPVASVMLVSDMYIRNILLALYVIFTGLYAWTTPIKLRTHKHRSGHLQWNYCDQSKSKKCHNIIYIIFQTLWFICFFSGFYYHFKFPYFALILGITLLLIAYNIRRQRLPVFNSNWCWIANGGAIVAAFVLLFVLPFREYQKICT